MKDWAKPLKDFLNTFSSKENKKPKKEENLSPLVGTMTAQDYNVKKLDKDNKAPKAKPVDNSHEK